jgi:hypothetical protein
MLLHAVALRFVPLFGTVLQHVAMAAHKSYELLPSSCPEQATQRTLLIIKHHHC